MEIDFTSLEEFLEYEFLEFWVDTHTCIAHDNFNFLNAGTYSTVANLNCDPAAVRRIFNGIHDQVIEQFEKQVRVCIDRWQVLKVPCFQGQSTFFQRRLECLLNFHNDKADLNFFSDKLKGFVVDF